MTSRRIVLGLDGSPGSEAAMQWCIEASPPLDAEVVAVHVLAELLLGSVPHLLSHHAMRPVPVVPAV
jgi:Universal stress protein family